MAYKVHLTDGSIETVADAETIQQDGSGLRLYNADGDMVAAYRDGEYRRASNAANVVETPPEPEPEQAE